MYNNKPLRYTLTALFSVGAMALIGILSFSGMLYLASIVAAGVVSSILAVLIEGEIYKQNIYSGVGMLLHFGQFIKRNNYCNKFKALANNKELRNNCQLLKDYYKLLKHNEALQHAKSLDEDQKTDLTRTETSLAEMEDFFIRYLQNELDEENPTIKALTLGLFKNHAKKAQTQAHLQANIQWEQTWLWRSMPITVTGGAMTVLVMASQLSGSIISSGILMTPYLMCALVWPLAGLAAVGFMVMIYKTFVDIIHHKKLQKHLTSFKKLFNEEKSTTTKILYAVGMVLLTLLAIVATIATAGTWWTAAQAGLTLLPFIASTSNVFRTVISTTGMALLGIGLFIFDYANSLESFKMLTAKLSRANVPQEELETVEQMPQFKKLFTIIRYNIQHNFREWAKNPWGVLLNPFTWFNRMIEIPFRFILFILHSISIGVTSDRLGNLSPWITAAIGTAQEGMTDIPYLWGADDHDHHHAKHKHSHKMPKQQHHHQEHPQHLSEDDTLKQKLISTKLKQEHHHDHHQQELIIHDHHHSDLAGYFLNFILFPTKLASAVWNSVCGEKEFADYFWAEMGVGKQEKIKQHQTSAKWQHYSVDEKLSKEINRLAKPAASDELASDKKAILEKARNEIRVKQPQLTVNTHPHKKSTSPLKHFITKADKQTLSENRSLFFTQEITRSRQALHEIKDEFPNLQLITA